MFKNSLPSIEQFAAFLDGNLSQNEMQQFSQLAEHNNTMNQLLDASDVIDDTMVGFTEADLQLPHELIGSNFEIPNVENADYLSLAGDSFSDNDYLYQQKGMNGYQKQGESQYSIIDEIFDELDNITEDSDAIETDIGIDADISDNIDEDRKSVV